MLLNNYPGKKINCVLNGRMAESFSSLWGLICEWHGCRGRGMGWGDWWSNLDHLYMTPSFSKKGSVFQIFISTMRLWAHGGYASSRRKGIVMQRFTQHSPVDPAGPDRCLYLLPLWCKRILLHLRHPHTLVLFVLTPGQPMLAAGLPQYLLRVSGQVRLQEGNIVLSSLISPIPRNQAMPLHLIGMSPSWLLPDASEPRPHALVFPGLYLSECFKYISLSGMSIFEAGRWGHTDLIICPPPIRHHASLCWKSCFLLLLPLWKAIQFSHSCFLQGTLCVWA